MVIKKWLVILEQLDKCFFLFYYFPVMEMIAF